MSVVNKPAYPLYVMWFAEFEGPDLQVIPALGVTPEQALKKFGVDGTLEPFTSGVTSWVVGDHTLQLFTNRDDLVTLAQDLYELNEDGDEDMDTEIENDYWPDELGPMPTRKECGL